jgi:hypothetical protein
VTRPVPKTAKPMKDAPKDGTIIDLFHEQYGWVTDVWWDEQDGIWVTACPSPFAGWRSTKYEYPNG